MGRFNHGKAHNRLVGLAVIVCATIQASAHWPVAAGALRRIRGVSHQLLRFFARVDHGANHAIDSGVQNFHQHRRFQPRHPHQGHRLGDGDRLQHRHERLVVDQSMLHIDGQAVPTLLGHDFGGKAVRHGEPAVDRNPTGIPDCPELVFHSYI